MFTQPGLATVLVESSQLGLRWTAGACDTDMKKHDQGQRSVANQYLSALSDKSVENYLRELQAGDCDCDR